MTVAERLQLCIERVHVFCVTAHLEVEDRTAPFLVDGLATWEAERVDASVDKYEKVLKVGFLDLNGELHCFQHCFPNVAGGCWFGKIIRLFHLLCEHKQYCNKKLPEGSFLIGFWIDYIVRERTLCLISTNVLSYSNPSEKRSNEEVFNGWVICCFLTMLSL